MWILANSERVMINTDNIKGIGVYPDKRDGKKKFNIEADNVVLSAYDNKEDAEDDIFSLWDAIGRKDKNFKF